MTSKLSPEFWATSEHFIGTKELDAIPMTRGEYNLVRGWDIPEDEDPADGGYIVRYQDGYVSWSPEMTFDSAYGQSGKFSFGDALHFLKEGEKLARAGWNGNNMWIILIPRTPVVSVSDGSAYQRFGISQTSIDSHIDMMTAQGTMQPGWLASQADMLANDWEIV